MNKKKHILTILIIIVSIITINNYNVNAKSYNSGDLVEIKLNDHESKKFYIIKNSDNTQDTVTAILTTVIGDGFDFTPKNTTFENSFPDQMLKSLTSSWKTPTEIRLITKDEVENNKIYQGDGSNYWTQTIILQAEEFYPYLVNITKNSDKSLTAELLMINDTNRDNKGFIRPVITINKSYIIGDKTDDNTNENKLLWDAFIKKLITEINNNNNNDNKNYTQSLNYSDNDLKITNKDNNENTYTSTFTYKDGVLSLVPVDNITLEQAKADYAAISSIIKSYSEIKGYDYQQLLEYIENNKNLQLKTDGIEITYKNFETNLRYPITFSLDLSKGLTSYEKFLATKNPISQDQTINVPNTKENTPSYIKNTAIILILIGIAILIEEHYRKRKHKTIK